MRDGEYHPCRGDGVQLSALSYNKFRAAANPQ